MSTQDPYVLPEALPVPVDDGAADHLEGMIIPRLELPTTDELEELSPMEVSFESGEKSEVVPVSFESVVTETGMLQLWCVARDGRRWKLEFNVRERVNA